MGNRFETLIGQDLVAGFRHLYSGTIMDVHDMQEVRILDSNLNTIHVIPGTSVTRTGLGTYEAVIPGSVLNTPGTYYDVWRFQPLSTSAVRNLRFSINVVTHESAAQPDFNTLLNCTLGDLSACMLKRMYLWPVRSSIANYYLPDDLLQHHIDSAISHFQLMLSLPLRQIRVMTKPFNPDLPGAPQAGIDYDELGSLLQYSVIEGKDRWSSFRLPHSQIVRINSVRGVYNNRVVYYIPIEWVDGNEFSNGWVRIRPTTAGVSRYLLDETGRFLEWMLFESVGTTTVPGFWAVDYTYGPKDGTIPKALCDTIMKRASIHILDQLGMEITRGIGTRSAGVDGLSSSLSYMASADRSMFGSLVARYEQDLSEEHMMNLRRKLKGPTIFIM